jgi:hypothetical protein
MAGCWSLGSSCCHTRTWPGALPIVVQKQRFYIWPPKSRVRQGGEIVAAAQFERLAASSAASAEGNLWSAVIVQLLNDSRRPALDPRSRAEQKAARQWLSQPSRDLHTILGYVNVNLEWWHCRVVPTLLGQWQVLDEAHPESDDKRLRDVRKGLCPQVWTRAVA